MCGTPFPAGDGDGSHGKGRRTNVGPWHKGIVSWICDVMDHFRHNRNLVSEALRFVDQYVGHLLTEDSRSLRPSGAGAGSARGSGASPGEPIKRRHFQLIAVTLLYLTSKVHGELMQ